MRRAVTMAVVSMGLAGLLPAAASAQDCATAIAALSPFDGTPDDTGLQCLLDQGGTVALQPGGQGYVLAAGLRLSVDGTRLVSAVPGQYARLVAHASLNGVMLKMRNNAPVHNFEIGNLIIDGNKSGRRASGLYPGACSADYRENGISLTLKGSGFAVHDVTFENAMCGSSLEVSGSGFNIYNNTIVNAGYEDGSVPGASQPFADGITLLQCIGANVTNNRVYDATDVGIVVGLSTTQNCNVSRNVVRNTSAYAFAGITNGGPTAHTGSYVSDNVVEAGYNKLGFGMYVGEGPWLQNGGVPPPTPDAGLVSGNAITGAVVNLAVDRIAAGVIRDNLLFGAQGTRGMLGCTWPAELTVGAVGGASVQPGGIYRTWQGVCTPYQNAAPSARITTPGDGASYLTSQSLTVSADAHDPDTAVSRVDFYANGAFVASDASAPFTLNVPAPLPVGTFDLTAIAYDGGTRGPTSNMRRISVSQAPSVTITSPSNNAQIPAGGMLTVAAGTTGAVFYVDFWAIINATGQLVYLGRDTAAPFSVTVGPVPYGDYTLGAVANDAVQSALITVRAR